MDGLPSSVAGAPAGLLVNITSCGTPARTGVGRSDLGVGAGGSEAAGVDGSGADLAGGVALESACPTSATPNGLGLASTGAAPGATAGAVAGGAAGTGDSSFDAAARCSPLSDGCEPGKCPRINCEPISAQKTE